MALKRRVNHLVAKTLQVINDFTNVGNFTTGGNHAVTGTLTVTGETTLEDLVIDSADVPTGATVVAGTEADNVVNVVITLLNASDTAIGNAATVDWWLSDSSDGSDIAGTAPNGNLAIGTEGTLFHVVTDKVGFLTTNASGVCDIDVTDSGTDTWYLAVRLPTGQVVVSNAITTAA